ncbi:MAG: hypothetical protein J0G32_07920, partial [Alphaproteobacteria bacterium]|nr:hypothetical protein [Alphaproteobacteria bacterium]
ACQLQADKWSQNLKNFLNDKKSVDIIMEMPQSERGIYASFIAFGNKKGQNQHLEATVDFAVDLIADEVLEGELDLDIYSNEEEAKLAVKEKLKEKIRDFIMGLLSEELGQDYYEDLGQLVAIIKNRKKVSSQIQSMLQLAIQNQLKLSKTKLSKTSLLTAITAGAFGLGVGLFGGFSLIDVVLPLSFGISGAIIGKEFLKINQINKKQPKDLHPNDLNVNLDPIQKTELQSEMRKQKKAKKLNRLFASEEMKEAAKDFQIHASVKGVFSNEVDYSISKVSARDKSQSQQVEKNNNGGAGGRKL